MSAVMPPNLRAPADRSLVRLDEDWEVEYWTNKLEATREDIQRAIRAADSHNLQLVRKELGS